MESVFENQQGLLTINYPNITSESISSEVQKMVSAVENGDVDPIKAIAYINAVDKILKEVRSKVMDMALDEFAKYGEKEISVLDGCKISQVEAGVRYDYSNCEKWRTIKENEDAISSQRKSLEKTLQTITKPIQSIDEETGEVLSLFPPIRTSTTTLKVVIK